MITSVQVPLHLVSRIRTQMDQNETKLQCDKQTMDYEYKIFIVSKKIQYPVLQTSSQICHMVRYTCTKACEHHDYQQIFIFIIASHMHVHNYYVTCTQFITAIHVLTQVIASVAIHQWVTSQLIFTRISQKCAVCSINKWM